MSTVFLAFICGFLTLAACSVMRDEKPRDVAYWGLTGGVTWMLCMWSPVGALLLGLAVAVLCIIGEFVWHLARKAVAAWDEFYGPVYLKLRQWRYQYLPPTC